jgi:ATP-independent RNA helicase DbpA
VLIGTPGRIADHLRRETFRPDSVRWLVLDEFDKSLQLGFEEQMTFIIGQLSGLRKRTLLSATAMKGIPGFVGLKKPVELKYLTGAPPEGLALKKVSTGSADKLETLFRLLCRIGHDATLIFCNHRDAADRIHSTLSEWGLVTDLYHGGLEQDERERALIKFRNGSTRLLITTDLASRGLDIPEIRNVIHYQLPDTPEAFVHRNGRTARMHAEGKAYLLISEEDTVPSYLTDSAEAEEASEAPLPLPPPWVTIHISAGKKEKISKTDVVGLLTQKGKLPKEGVGRIEIGDHASFVAVDRTKARTALALVKEEKIKGIKVKIRMAR